MLDDRYYMRRSPFDSRRSATVVLLLVNVAVFVAQFIVEQTSGFRFAEYFALSLSGLAHGKVWQLLTYEFLHAGGLHLLFNCWAIYIFGRDVEQALGRNQFLTLYFASGILGGLVQVLFGLLIPRFAAPVVGASAAAFGLVSAFAMLFPDRILLLFFFIPMRAKYLLLLSAALALLGIMQPKGDGVAHAAHLGGMLTGLLFIRYAVHWDLRWPSFRRARKRSPRQLVKVGSKSALWRSGPKEQELPPEEFLSREVDPILDKISAQGIQSLTERERRILETARQKMAKR